MKTEPMMNSCDSAGAESTSNLNGCDDMDEWTEGKPGFIMTREQACILNNIKTEEDWESMSVKMSNMKKEEGWESLNVKMESKDGVKDEKGFWKEEAVEWNELWRRFSTGHKLEKNRVKSEYGHQEGEELHFLGSSCQLKQPTMLIGGLEICNNSVPVASPPRPKAYERGQGTTTPEESITGHRLIKGEMKSQYGHRERDASSMLVISCLMKQPRVLICRYRNSNNSVPVPSPPCALDCKGDRGAASLLKQQKLSPLVDNGSLSGGVTEKTVGQSEVPLNLLPSSSEKGICNTASSSSPVITSSCQDTGQTAEVSSQVFTCPQCPFFHLEEMSLRKHIENVHPEELSRPQRSQQPASSPQQNLTLTQSQTGKPEAHVCSHCGKSFVNKHTLRDHKKRHKEHQFQCSYCDKTFAVSYKKVEHERIHTGERPYRCSKCDKTYTMKFLLNRHQRVHSDERLGDTATGLALHACSQCGKSFKTKCSLYLHKNLHREHRYWCSHCSKTFARADKLRLHERTHTGERPYPCSQCDKTFSRADKLKIHQRVHSGERPYSCSQCGKRFTQSNILKAHLQTHTGERPYHCSQCANSYATRHSLMLHQRTHTEERPFRCLQCGNHFIARGSLRRHQQRFHTPMPNAHTKRPGSTQTASVAERTFPQCEPRYKSQSLLKSHLGTLENLNRCSHCDKSFSFPCRLRRHEQIHTGKRPYRCSQCGKGFRTAGQLTIHRRIHTGERPYSCAFCDKKWRTSSHLRRHERTHASPYCCTHCDKKFIASSALKAHKRIHAGVHPYHCAQCKMSFSELHLLKHHQKVHTDKSPHRNSQYGKKLGELRPAVPHQKASSGECPFRCSQCGRSFSQPVYLKLHQLTHTV